MSDNPLAKYAVDFTINVQRLDNQMLTAEENTMVEEMREATHAAIAAIMARHGQRTLTRLDKKIVY